MSDKLKGESNVHFLYQAPAEVPGESHLYGQTAVQSGHSRPDSSPAEGCGGLQTHASHVMVPVEPHLGVLVSMAVCMDHGFGLLAPEHQESKLNDMRKLYDEVVGRGYYRPERDQYYQGFVSINTRAEFSEQLLVPWTPICD